VCLLMNMHPFDLVPHHAPQKVLELQSETLHWARANLMKLLFSMVTHSVFDRACAQPTDAQPPASPNATLAVDTPAIESLKVSEAAGRQRGAAYIPLAVQQFAPEVVTQLEAYIRSVEADRAAGTPHSKQVSEALVHVTIMCCMPVTACGKTALALLC